MSARLNRRGAILPMTILMLAIMAVAVAITYARLSSEHRTTSDAQAQMAAFHVAQSGLARHLSILPVSVKPGWGTTTATYNDLPGGTATVTMRMVRDSTVGLLPSIYAITSVGTHTTAKRYGAFTAPAQRTVATYALWTPAPFDLNGAVTSLNGMTKAGTSGSLSGYDNCGASPAIAGVAVPGGSGVGGTYGGPVSPINGNPEDAAGDLGTPGPAGSAVNEVDIDWAAITAGTTLPPNYVLPAWPTSTQFLDWPVVRVNNTAGPEYSLTGDGKGILIVTGDFKMNGSLRWDGLILVGGKLTSVGNNTVYGAVVAGLNIKLGMAVGPSDVAAGNKTYQYDSCALQRALGTIGSIQRVRNGWTDTWPSY